MRTMLLGVLVTLIVLGITALALAVPAHKTLTPVTVSVQGLHCQGCVDELQQDLAKMRGVSAVNVMLQPGQVTAKLDETTIPASKFVATITNHRQMMDHSKTYGAHLVLFVDCPCCAKRTTMCPACFTEIPKALKTVQGVSSVSLDATGKVASVTPSATMPASRRTHWQKSCKRARANSPSAFLPPKPPRRNPVAAAADVAVVAAVAAAATNRRSTDGTGAPASPPANERARSYKSQRGHAD